MLISEVFPNAFFKAVDVMREPDGALLLEIESCEKESVGESGDMLPVVRFKNQGSGLVINKTNSNTLKGAFGNDTDEWKGHQCIIYATKTTFKGELVDALRVKIPDQPERKPEPQVVNVDNDDEVPF